MTDKLSFVQEQLAEILVKARRVFVFTGAGASKESGLPTFREADATWKNYDPIAFATLDGFMQDPVQVWNMYRLRQHQIAQAQPNPGHITIAKMEQHYPEFLLATQNVDDLHERAGNKKMVKIHGDAWQMRCLECNEVYDVRDYELPEEFTQETLPKCPECNNLCRPNIVWFGEYVPQIAISSAMEGAKSCDLMFIVGTSGQVSNGYGLAEIALSSGAKVIEINPAQGVLTPYAHIWVPEPAGQALPRIWKILDI